MEGLLVLVLVAAWVWLAGAWAVDSGADGEGFCSLPLMEAIDRGRMGRLNKGWTIELFSYGAGLVNEEWNGIE